MPNLPYDIPLDRLRVFETTARLLSITAAAAELGTSQPAVSQQIKRLEQILAVRLFDRLHRGLALTEAGGVLYAATQDGMARLAAGLAAVRSYGQQEVLQVATDYAFAAYWLMPRLQRFHELHPDVDVSLLTRDRGLAAHTSTVDVMVGFGDGRTKHGEAQFLFHEEVFPVCSPVLLERFPDVPLHDLPLLHLRPDPRVHWFDWETVFRALNMPSTAVAGGLRFDNYTLVIQAALASQGVAIGWRYLVDDLIAQGMLCRIGTESATSAMGYWLIVPDRKRRASLVDRFVSWLHVELGIASASGAA
ncbi:choline sulfate utilization transcriptional regulator [Pseudomonas sp. Marseille-QA0892]